MQPGGALSSIFGPLVGTGPGAGMGLMFVLAGGMAALIATLAYTVPTLREVESRIPDHDALQVEPVSV